MIDAGTNTTMRNKLGSTFGSLAQPCVDALKGVTGMDMPALKNFGNSLNFYDATSGSQYAANTQDDVSGNGSTTTLAGTFAGSSDPVAKTIVDGQAPAILIGANFAGRSAQLQGGILVHEFLHASMGVGDNQLFDALAKYGLKRQDPYGTEEISTWFAEGCKKQQ